MKYDITSEGTKAAKWSYIKAFIDKDQTLNIRYALELTKHHFEISSFSKLRVSFAVQVLSRTVAAGILTHGSFGSLAPEAVYTSEFCEKIDTLFDSLISTSSRAGRDCRRSVREGSCHVQLWQETLPWLKTWKIGSKKKVWFLDG